MPKKLATQFVKDQFEKYGYTVPDDFSYKNNVTHYNVIDNTTGRHISLTYKQLQYRIKRGRAEYIPPNPFMNLPLTESRQSKPSFKRWADQQDEIKNLPPEQQFNAYNFYNNALLKLLKKKDFDLTFSENESTFELLAFIEAAKKASLKLSDFDIKLTLTDIHGNVDYRHLNPNTIHFLTNTLNDSDMARITDSDDAMFDSILYIQTMHVEFIPNKKSKRIVAGFFPYINKSDIDLKRYGVFNSIDEEDINDSCLIHAFKCSGILTTDELNMLKSFVTTRIVPQTALKDIADLLKIHINCKVLYEDTGKLSHEDYGEEYDGDPLKSTSEKNSVQNANARRIKLIITNSHYLLNERTNISECYIKRYDEINNDNRFKNHKRKMMLQKFDSNRYSFAKKGLKIHRLLYMMINQGLLVPMSDKQFSTVKWSFKPSTIDFNGSSETQLWSGISRKVWVGDKKDTKYKRVNRVKQTQHFFGYKPDEGEVDDRLNELQQVIDSLRLRKHVNVRLYYKFSELMQKIIFEYGCYDNVYELSGNEAKSIRNECVFPKIKTFNEKPFYSNEKLYYIDLNGAYMSAVKYIPTGKVDSEGNFEGKCTKIKHLIEELYEARIKAKKEGKDKLATTLKFLMTSSWGWSIRRPKVIKNHYVKDVNTYIETYAPFVIKYKYNKDGFSGFVDTINPFVPHFTIPQFARSVLNEFKSKIDKIKKLVNVYYENIDAILINESDYLKLNELGYIGDELGQFKIEHIFTEIAIKSTKRYVATLDNGTKYYHCVKDTVDYNEFVNEVKALI